MNREKITYKSNAYGKNIPKVLNSHFN